MANEIYDQLAELLKEMHARFPNDAFKNRLRLKGMLEDHTEGTQGEMGILLDAIDEGVVDALRESSTAELGMQIDRQVAHLEKNRGIREDIARQVVQAYAYAIGVGGLPSSVSSSSPAPKNLKSNDTNDWRGLSDVVDDPKIPDPVKQSFGWSDFYLKNKNNLWIAAAAGAIALYTFSQQGSQQPQQPEQRQPEQRQPEQRQPQQGTAVWYGDVYNSKWRIQYTQTQFTGNDVVNGVPYTMQGQIQGSNITYDILDSSKNKIAYGQGIFVDSSHISFTTYNINGQVNAMGKFHINHRPR